MPDNREMATAILLLGFVVFGLTVRSARERIPDIIRSAAPLTWRLAIYLASAYLVVWGAWSIGLWAADLWWSTSIVALGLGLSLVSSAVDSRSVRALWESIASKTIGAAVFIGLYANLAPFPLIVELLLQALAAFAAMLRVVAEHQGQTPVRRLADVVLSLIGLAAVVRTTTVLAHGVPGSELLGLLKQVLLSIWFPFALVPLLYLVSYFGTVEMAAVGVRVVAPREIKKWPTVRRLLLAFRLRLSLAAAFDRQWGRRYANASSKRERRRVLSQFRHVERPRFAIPRRASPAWLGRVIRRSDVADEWDGRAMPRTVTHLMQMLDRRPPGWEWMAFGAHLWIGMAGQRSKYREHRRRHAVRSEAERFDSHASLSHLADEIGRGALLVEPIVDMLSEERQERAFGPPGEPGNPDEIRDLAHEVVSLYVAVMDWCARLRGTRVPIRHRRAYRAAARLMDGSVEQLRHFVASLAMELDQVPNHASTGASPPLTIVLTVALSVRPEDQARLDRTLSRISHATAGALPDLQVQA